VCSSDLAAGHTGHADVYRRRFWITLILAVPVVLYSEMVQDWFGYTAPEFRGDGLVAPVLGTVVFFYGGWVFLTGAWSEIQRASARDDAPGLDLARCPGRHPRQGSSQP